MLDFDCRSGELTNKKASLLERYIGMVNNMPDNRSKPTIGLVEFDHLVLLGVLGKFEVHLVTFVLAVNHVVG